MTGYPVLDVFWTTMYVVGWILWITLVIWVVWDIFRSADLSGWGKAGWLLVVVVLPLVGVVIYLIARGGAMHERRASQLRGTDSTLWDYSAEAGDAGSRRQSEELARLDGLHQRGVLNDEEYERARARVV
jgi:hypothetical protein